MTGKKIPMTVTGHQVLVDELDNLKRVVRKEVIAAIAEARAHSSAWLDAHERHEAKKALDHAAKIPVPTGMMDRTLSDNLWKKE